MEKCFLEDYSEHKQRRENGDLPALLLYTVKPSVEAQPAGWRTVQAIAVRMITVTGRPVEGSINNMPVGHLTQATGMEG